MKGAAVCVLMVLAVAQLMVDPGHAITCGDVTKCIGPCVPFLTGTQPNPGNACCAGVNQLKGLAPTTTDRRAACACVKTAAANFKNLNADAVSSLPAQCGTPLPFPINKDTNCEIIP
ncbi:non-specific lipid-transfer protein A-like [Magnolia sinica]|uniref:non-specific lipid-transfer protein A-like n=1 Tax=Magnolia sinica TaxID=86752 RepID=UPI002658539D|nr:non-specific lipid-transfer protein A-like [Magnolia sinica]